MRVEAPWWDKSLEKKTTFSLFLCHVSTQSEDSHKQTRKNPAPDIRSAGALILDFPTSRTMRSTCLLSQPPHLRCSVLLLLFSHKVVSESL